MRHPWFKFYPSDWRGDPKLRACSAVSRLLWLEMFCLSHEAEPYGYVLVSGHAPTPSQLAAIAGLTVRQVTASLAELEAAGVFSRNELGVIYSRRMVRDRATAERRAAGGGKSLEHPHVPRPSGEPEGILEGIHQGRPQIPDTRSQRTTTTLPATASEAERAVRVSLPVADYVQAFERLLRAAMKPDSLAASIRGFGPGGIHECASWDELGHALMDLAAAPGTATPAALKAFIRRIQAGDPPPRQHGTPRPTQREKSLAVLDAALAREDAA
jgi:hypothetical protein